MEQWLSQHLAEGVLGGLLAWLGYNVRRRDKKVDDIEKKIDQMPFVYAMKEDVSEIKQDVKDILRYLMEKN